MENLQQNPSSDKGKMKEAEGNVPKQNPSPFSPSAMNCVVLYNWWLIKTETKNGEKGIGVAGFESITKTQAKRIYKSGPIIKRHDSFNIETDTGISILLQGMINKKQTQQNGFSTEVCDKFLIGFPFFWEQYKEISNTNTPNFSTNSSTNISNLNNLLKFIISNDEKFEFNPNSPNPNPTVSKDDSCKNTPAKKEASSENNISKNIPAKKEVYFKDDIYENTPAVKEDSSKDNDIYEDTPVQKENSFKDNICEDTPAQKDVLSGKENEGEKCNNMHNISQVKDKKKGKKNLSAQKTPITRSLCQQTSLVSPDCFKRTRSGRVIVPKLDKGTQKIVYDMDEIIGISDISPSIGKMSQPSKKGKKIK